MKQIKKAESFSYHEIERAMLSWFGIWSKLIMTLNKNCLEIIYIWVKMWYY